MQDLLLKAVRKENYEENLSFVTAFYKNDFNPPQLKLHIDTLAANFPDEAISSVTIFDIKHYVLNLSPSATRFLISEVCTVLKLIFVSPATNTVSERSFSALRRVKTYRRSTMLQTRLNHLLLLHVHKERTDSLDLATVCKEFVSMSERKQN